MSGFQMPDFSSSPPATPDKRPNNGNNLFSFGASNPSTTPAGPPPSSTGTFTPAGQPPSSFLGSSILGSANPIKPLSFSQKANTASQPNFNTSNQFSLSPSFMRSTANTDYQASQQGYTQPQADYSEEEDEEDMEDGGPYEYQAGLPQSQNTFQEGFGYGEGDGETITDEDDYMDDLQPGDQAGNGNHFSRSSSDLLLATPTALKESREGYHDGLGSTQAAKSTYKHIAKDLSIRLGVPAIEESDTVVLNTESIITSLYDEGFAADNDALLQEALLNIPGELIAVWTEYARQTKRYQSEEYTATIGPGPDSSNFAKANFIAVLALRLHHPEITYDLTRAKKPVDLNSKPLPQTILEWMDANHNPFPSQVQEIQVHRPSPANHPQFWDITMNSLLRGGVAVVVNILKTAGWRHASTGLDGLRNSNGQVGYTGVALSNVERVIGAVIQVLEQCPAIHEDWNIRGSEWTMFRMRASQALEDLKRFAEGRNKDDPEEVDAGQSGTFSRTAKKAESQVPWDLYQNLLSLYGILIGESNAIVASSTDWCEATVGLAVWWDEGKEDRRMAFGRSRGQSRGIPKDTDPEILLRKLRRSFEVATAEGSEFQVNTMDPIEVSLASLFEGDNESVITILRGWSGPISSAVAEIASLAKWLPEAKPENLITMNSLSREDMAVLGISASPSKADSTKDQTLITYARSLADRDQLKAGGFQPRDGWEVAIAVLGRLDSVDRTESMIGDFLKNFPLDNSTTVDKLWRLLNSIGMTGHAESTAESYAKQLADHTHKYGEALWYYSLSHKTQKVKDVLDLLISLSLVQSTAYPSEDDMDDHLKRLISSPKNALMEISKMDIEAAELLQKLLSGYATLRKFYTLRDEDISNTQKSQRSSLTRKKEAALALLAVITSSDDNIRGGLYDEERGAVVNVDFLLALLGEAMVLVNQPDFSISASHIDILLKAIEDIQAVGPRIYTACNEFLQTVLASTGLKGSTPTDMLRKSTSNVSGTSSFSLVGSSMLASQLKQSMGSSGVLVKGNIKRGWDWRENVSAGTTGDDVLRILRLGLAKDLAKAWLLEVDNLV